MDFINSKLIENEKSDEDFNRIEFQNSFLETIQVSNKNFYRLIIKKKLLKSTK